MATTEHNEITLIKRNQSKVVRTLSSRTAQPEQQPHNYMILANSIFYNGQSADRIYLNGAKIWEKTVTPPQTYSNVLAGKFTDDSNSSYWYWMPDYKKTSLSTAVNRTTKEFYLELDEPLGKMWNSLFSPASGYNYYERIDSIPDSSNSTSFSAMFSFNRYLISVNLSNLNTSNVTLFNTMFSYCEALTTIDCSGFDTSNAIDMQQMFLRCKALINPNISSFNTSKVANMQSMFSNCQALTTLNLSHFDTGEVSNMESMFDTCSALTTLNLSGWDFGVCTNAKYMFDYDTALTTVLGPITGIAVDLDLKHCPLTVESAMTFINGLAQVGTAKTIKFKATTYDALTPEQIAVATNKGWNVVRY